MWFFSDSVNVSLIYETSNKNVFKNTKPFGKIYSHWPNDLLGTNI